MIKLFEDWLNETKMTSTEINNYIKELTPDEDNIPDHFLYLIKKSKKKFDLKRVDINSLLQNDLGLKEYVLSNKPRYDKYSDHTPESDDVYQPIVVFNNEVVDGYSRVSTLYNNGETQVDAWVSE